MAYGYGLWQVMIPYGNNPLFRALFGWLLPLDTTFMKLTTTKGVRELQIQKQVCASLSPLRLVSSWDSLNLNPTLGSPGCLPLCLSFVTDLPGHHTADDGLGGVDQPL